MKGRDWNALRLMTKTKQAHAERANEISVTEEYNNEVFFYRRIFLQRMPNFILLIVTLQHGAWRWLGVQLATEDKKHSKSRYTLQSSI